MKALKISDLENELTHNKKLIQMTAGDEDDDGEEGSDSEPSEDNISEDDLAAIVPLRKEPEPAPVKPVV